MFHEADSTPKCACRPGWHNRAARVAGLDWPAAILLAILTATGGGVIRDLLSDQVPRVLHSEMNATAAACGGGDAGPLQLPLASQSLDLVALPHALESHLDAHHVLREGKTTTWDGGTRVPFIVWWPGHIPAGREQKEMACAIDLLPTLAARVGADVVHGCGVPCIRLRDESAAEHGLRGEP